MPGKVRVMNGIRQADLSDVDALVALWLRSVRATHDFLTKEDIEYFLPLVRKALASDQLDLWVIASDSNSLMGFTDPQRGHAHGRRERAEPGGAALL